MFFECSKACVHSDTSLHIKAQIKTAHNHWIMGFTRFLSAFFIGYKYNTKAIKTLLAIEAW